MYDGYSFSWGDIEKNWLLSMYYVHRGYQDLDQIIDTNYVSKIYLKSMEQQVECIHGHILTCMSTRRQ